MLAAAVLSAAAGASMRFYGREATVAFLTDTAHDIARTPLDAGCAGGGAGLTQLMRGGITLPPPARRPPLPGREAVRAAGCGAELRAHATLKDLAKTKGRNLRQPASAVDAARAGDR